MNILNISEYFEKGAVLSGEGTRMYNMGWVPGQVSKGKTTGTVVESSEGTFEA